MKKQLIIKIPETASSLEIQTLVDMQTQAYGLNYPLYMFPGWNYEIVEVSEPLGIITQSKNINVKELIKETEKQNNVRIL